MLEVGIVATRIRRMEGVRFRRPIWTVMRYAENADGRIDEATRVGSFWNKTQADEEASRLNDANGQAAVFFEVLESVATGVYPADEEPPWVPDLKRLARRGYETTE
jgi:hypothetical protein